MSRADILLFLEDPGAANFIGKARGLTSTLGARGLSVHIATRGVATSHLTQRGIDATPVPDDVGPTALLDRVNPKLIAVGTSENSETLGLELVTTARARKLPTLGLVDSIANAPFRFRGRTSDPLQWCPDRIAVPDLATRDEFTSLGLSVDRIVVTGHPHWDDVREFNNERSASRRRLIRDALPHCDNNRQVIVFAAETSAGFDPAQFRISPDYTIKGSGRNTGRTEIVLDELLSALRSMRKRTYLILRLHPKNVRSDFEEHACEFDYISEKEAPLDVLAASDAVVGMTSMLLIEAALMGKPTLSIVPRPGEARWLPTVAAGTTPCAASRADVEREIAAIVSDPKKVDRAVLERIFPTGALERLATTITDLVR